MPLGLVEQRQFDRRRCIGLEGRSIVEPSYQPGDRTAQALDRFQRAGTVDRLPLAKAVEDHFGPTVGCQGGLLWIEENRVGSSVGQTRVVVASTVTCGGRPRSTSWPVVRAKAG